MRLRIESASNARLKATRALDSRQGILKQGAFLVEGPRFVSDALSVLPPRWIVLASGAAPSAEAVAGRAEEEGVDILEVPEKLFRDLSDTVHSQGILAVCPLPPTEAADIPPSGPLLLLDGVADPGNTGTLIRSAAAFGCAAVLLGKGSCFPFLPKANRASAGTALLLPVIPDADLPEVMEALGETRLFLGAEASGRPVETLELAGGDVGLVIGSEAHGISDPVRERLSGSVAIAMAEGVESLNAAVSGSILLYLLTRGRKI